MARTGPPRSGALRLALAVALVGTALAAPSPAAEAPPPSAPSPRLGPPPPPSSHPPLERAVQRQQYRQEKANLGALIERLGVAPGMSVLDIGAGPGYASFLFAERLRGTGRVYATDIRTDFVEYIAEEAQRRGLANLTAAVVSETGLDPFYGRQRYDLVFLSNVYHCLADRVSYFTGLREALNPGARLVLVLYNQTPLFSEEDLLRFDGLVASLAADPPESPFAARLSEATRELLRSRADAAALKSALVEDFNRMLTDPQFHRGFYRDSYFTRDLLSPAERDLANWLLMTLAEEGALDGPLDPGDERRLRAVIKLNRLFFIKRFGEFLAQGGMGAYLPAGDANRHTSKLVTLRELDAAGYRFVEQIRLSPYYDAVIMAPKAP